MLMSRNINRRSWLKVKVSNMSLKWLVIWTRLTNAEKWQVCYAQYNLLLLFRVHPVEIMASNEVNRNENARDGWHNR